MLKVFESSKVYVKIKPLTKVIIDSFVFRLHCKFTVAILVAFSVIVCTKEYVGSPIECLTDPKEPRVPKDFMEAHCWVHSTYTIMNLLDGEDEMGNYGAYPGVGTLQDYHQVKYHRYYQWVPILLALQALAFCAPHFLWAVCEGNRIQMMVEDIIKIESDPKRTLEKSREERKKRIALIVNYFVRGGYSWKTNNLYAFQYFFCEFLNIINVVSQFILINVFLGYEFTTYGLDALMLSETDPYTRVDPMAKVFPKVTKCVFKMYGPTGQIVPYDALCILSVNVFNEKIYIFLYFWFIFVAGITATSLMFRIMSCIIPKFRIQLLLTSRVADPISVVTVSNIFTFGDWFLLRQVGRNLDRLDPLIFWEIIQGLAQEINKNGKIKV